MRPLRLLLLSSLAPAVLLAASARPAFADAAPGCVKDIECKGDRICVAGQCVDPPAAHPVVSSPVLAPAPPVAAPTEPAPSPAPPPPPPAAPVVPAPPAPASPSASAPPMAPPTPAPLPSAMAVPAENPSAPPTMVVIYTPPSAEKVSDTGLTLGVRAGVGLPSGNAVPPQTDLMGGVVTGNLADLVGILLSAQIDAGYRLTPHWYVGAYFALGYGTATAGCAVDGTTTVSCNETDYRIGLDLQYRVLPTAVLQPWVGVGAGWEVLDEFSSNGSQGSTNGVELAHIDVGLDYRLTDRQRLGAFFTTTFGDFYNAPAANTPTTQSLYVHEWYIFGARWQFDTNYLSR